MSRAVYRRVWLLALINCLALAGFAQTQPPRQANATEAAVEELAAVLSAAKTDEERTTLLAAKKGLQTPALVQALLRQGNRLRAQQGLYPEALVPQALTIFQLAQRLAKQLGDKAGVAAALSNLGDLYRLRLGNLSDVTIRRSNWRCVRS